MFKRYPSDTQFLIITAFLVVLLGVPTFFTLISGEPAEIHASALIKPTGKDSRQPASVPSSSVKVPSSLVHFTHDLNCAKKASNTVTVTGSYVQLHGKNCLKNLKSGDLEIINKSNGYTASVFNSGTDKYQTDLIQLIHGDNEIAIRYRERSGKTVEEVLRVHSPRI